MAEVFFLHTGKLVFFLLTLADVFLCRVVSDEFIAVVFPALKFKVFVALFIHIFIIEFIVIFVVIQALIFAIVVFDLNLNLIAQNQIIVQIVQWIKVILFNYLSLRLNDLPHVFNHTLLNLQVYLKFNVL